MKYFFKGILVTFLLALGAVGGVLANHHYEHKYDRVPFAMIAVSVDGDLQGLITVYQGHFDPDYAPYAQVEQNPSYYHAAEAVAEHLHTLKLGCPKVEIEGK